MTVTSPLPGVPWTSEDPDDMTDQIAARNAAAAAEVDAEAQIAAVIAGAPGALDTLNELAAALGDNPDFAADLPAIYATYPLDVGVWNPVSDGSTVASSATHVDVEASLLAVSVVFPASGQIRVRAMVGFVLAADSAMHLNLREASSDIAGTDRRMTYAQSVNTQGRVTYDVIVTGTPASSHTYKLGLSNGGVGGATSVYAGPSFGPAIIEAFPYYPPA